MKRLRQWFRDYANRCLEGRYGLDGLSALYLCAAISLAGCAYSLPAGTVKTILCLAAFTLAIYAIYRCFSRDRSRQKEQWNSFQNEIDEINYKISLHTGVWKIKRGYRYLKCKQCRFRYRVMKQKGKHTVTCPNCGSQRVIKH